MTKYRDQLTTDYGHDIGSVVGCALDRLNRPVTHEEITKAIEYYKVNAAEMKNMPYDTRRGKIAELFAKT